MSHTYHLLPILGLSHYDDVWVAAQKHPQALTHDMMIIGNQDANRHDSFLPGELTLLL